MSRGSLPDDSYDAISSRLPDVSAIYRRAWSFAPDWLSVKFPAGHQAPGASVCLHDCASRLYEIRHALFEYAAHGEYYRRFRTPPDVMVAVAMERFYFDDAALRMYAAAECLAAAVAAMLDIPKKEIRAIKKSKNPTSNHTAIGKYLRDRNPDHPLALALFELHELPPWGETMSYRNKWVHTQPPAIAGHGVVYRRGPRWQFDAHGDPVYLAVTTGDTPELTIDSLAANISGANEGLVGAVQKVLDEYEAQMAAVGFTRTETGGMSLTLFE